MARDAMRTFMCRLCPDSVEDRDYRLPCVHVLKRWRRYLEPICHFISLSAMDRADMVHLLSDAGTKRQVGVFHVNAKLEVRTEAGLTSQNIPVKFKVTRSGTGECEAEAACDSLDSDYPDLKVHLKDPEDRFLTVVSSTTDNAAAAVAASTMLRRKKHRTFDDLTSVYGADHDRLQDAIREMHVLTCTNHAHNLTTLLVEDGGASGKKGP